ncbi:MAG: dUTPase [Candidatus Aenigmarchaeota archaeon]|nr:dUTPase [Candidatus Aenigmarchaeota archaeon]
MEDKLERMFEEQKNLDTYIRNSQEKHGSGYEFSDKEWIDRITTAIIEEAMEIKEHSNWKWWKKPKDFTREELKEELADLLHFWLSLCLKLGFTPEEMFEKYMEKNRKNAERQDNGY